MTFKILSGIDFFDSVFGGAFLGRSLLVCGQAETGKTLAVLQFIAQGLKQGERGLILSAVPARNLVLQADALGLDLVSAMASEELVMLDYTDYIPNRDAEASITVTADCFQNLCDTIARFSVNRVALDSVVPWLTSTPLDHVQEYVFSFVNAFERLGASALFTMPRPVSRPAIELHHTLEDLLPISIDLATDAVNSLRFFTVRKYLGTDRSNHRRFVFEIKPGSVFSEVKLDSASGVGEHVSGVDDHYKVYSTQAGGHFRVRDS